MAAEDETDPAITKTSSPTAAIPIDVYKRQCGISDIQVLSMCISGFAVEVHLIPVTAFFDNLHRIAHNAPNAADDVIRKGQVLNQNCIDAYTCLLYTSRCV